MIELSVVTEILRDYGLWLLLPLAILEGPVVSVLAGWFSAMGLFNPWAAFAVMLLGDLLGDVLFYLIGRRGMAFLSRGWRRRLGLSAARVGAMARHFRDHGVKTLVIAKLTHAAGAVALVAAGAARMPLLPFVLANLASALPKVAALMALGWVFGAAIERVEGWLARFTLIGLVVVLLVLALWWEFRRRSQQAG
jgi:membrane protein DedA with SNARE-associated domain